MTYRKTWFSYVSWLLYTIVCVVLLVYAGSVWAGYFAGKPYADGFPDSLVAPLAGLPDGVLVLTGLLVIPLTIALYWMIRLVSERIRKKCVWKKAVMARFEFFIALLIMAGGIFLRIESAGFDISTSENVPAGYFDYDEIKYYEMAVVTEENAVSSVSCGSVEELYVICLSVVLSFLGNKIASAIIMQVFLQIAGMILVYAVTRKAAGRIPACTALLYIACSPACLAMLTCFGPGWFFFDIYLAGLLLAVSFVRSYCAGQFGRTASVVLAAQLGAAAGLLAYLHAASLTILVVLAAVVTGRKHWQEDGRKDRHACHFAGMNAAVVMAAFSAGVLVWAGLKALAYPGGPGLLSALAKELAYARVGVIPFAPGYPYGQDIYLMGVLVIPASFLVFEFLRSGREQNFTLWFLICILIAPTPMARIGNTPYWGEFSFYVWGVLAGLGLQNCIFGGRAKMVQAMIEEINANAETEWTGLPGELSEAGKNAGETAAKTGDPEEPGRAGEEGHAEPSQVSEKEENPRLTGQSSELTVEKAGGETGRPEIPRYFENPLPLPKRHVKREMDYQYQVDEKDMKYDVEVPENDDFDIQ